jgi:putative flippase GtrA
VSFVCIIPAYRPPEALIDLVRRLGGLGRPIVVVNDGSGDAFDALFRSVARLPNVVVCEHAINLGKGAALRTAMHVCLTRYRDATGIVTLDADGQHDPEDARRIGDRLDQKPGTLILGVRRFLGTVPLRSRIGNTLTRWLFRLLLGVSLTDTQTGLRGIPRALAKRLLKLRSRRYDFEMEMLIVCREVGVPIDQVEIRTIYLDGNATSHFHPVFDSLFIYFALLRFVGAGLCTAAIDNLVFITVFTAMGSSILVAQVAGRGVALVVNFLLLRNFVFRAREEPLAPPVLRYLLSVAGFGVIAYGMIHFLAEEFGTPVVLAKISVETLLFVVNFVVQRDLVFQRNREN